MAKLLYGGTYGVPDPSGETTVVYGVLLAALDTEVQDLALASNTDEGWILNGDTGDVLSFPDTGLWIVEATLTLDPSGEITAHNPTIRRPDPYEVEGLERT